MPSSNAITASTLTQLCLRSRNESQSEFRQSGQERSTSQQDANMDSDQILISRIQNEGCPVAFEEIYHRHRDYILNVASRYCVETSDAPDVLQDTMIAFSRALPKLELRVQLTTYLYSITRNCAFKANRKRRRWRVWESVETFQMQTVDGELLHRETSQDSLNSSERIEQILQIIPALKPKFQEILWLRFRDDFSLSEMAERLEIPVGTVKSRLNTALNHIRKRLQFSHSNMTQTL